jgi:hypothetical protein
MSGAIPPLPKYAFMVWCLVKHRDNFTFTLLGDQMMKCAGLGLISVSVVGEFNEFRLTSNSGSIVASAVLLYVPQ